MRYRPLGSNGRRAPWWASRRPLRTQRGRASRVGRPRSVLDADGAPAAQKVEVDALVGLEHVLQEELAVAARVVRLPRLPSGAAALQLLVAHRSVSFRLVTSS